MFSTVIGSPLDNGNLLRRVHYPLLAKAGVPRVTFHALRHSAAILRLSQGSHRKIVSDVLGHSAVGIRSTRTRTSRRRCSDKLRRHLRACRGPSGWPRTLWRRARSHLGRWTW